MTKYYKGNIINVNNFDESVYHLNIAKTGSEYQDNVVYYVLNDSSRKASLYFKKYSKDDFNKIVDDMTLLSTVHASDELKNYYDNLFADVFKMNANNVLGTSIIYEKIYDNEGNIYGKEIITGQIFPINSKYSGYDIVYIHEPVKKVYLDKEHGEVYYLDHFGNYLIDTNGKKYSINRYTSLDMYVESYSDTSHSVFINNNCISISLQYPECFTIKMKPKMAFPPNQRIEYAIAGDEIANELEVNNYVSKFETGLVKRKRKKDFIKSIKEKSLSNYLGDDINFVSNNIKKERVSEEIITKEMQELEFMLYRLKSVCEDDYNRLNNEYMEVLNHNNPNELYLNPLSINTIISIQNKAELAFICNGGNSKRILDYLANQAYICLDNYKNNNKNKTELSIEELDKICEHLLQSKNYYDAKEKNEILRNLSLLYFFVIYENRDVLNGADLLDSYVTDNIKRIIIIISILKDVSIIKNFPNTLYEITNTDELLDFIKKIEFYNLEEIDDEKINSLIKKIQH